MDEGIGWLVVVIVLLPIIIGIACIYVLLQVVEAIATLIAEHPEETVELLRTLAIGLVLILLGPQLAAAWLVLYLCRDLVVRFWPERFGEKQERLAVLAWTIVIPLLLTPAWLLLAVRVFSPVGLGWRIILASASTMALVGSYYYLYVRHPPLHVNWFNFLAQEEKMLCSIRLDYLKYWLRLRLWWAALWR